MVQALVRQRQKLFRTHPLIDVWITDFDRINYGKLVRWMILALVWKSWGGKTSKAVNIFGETNTLKVGCGTCPLGDALFDGI